MSHYCRALGWAAGAETIFPRNLTARRVVKAASGVRFSCFLIADAFKWADARAERVTAGTLAFALSSRGVKTQDAGRRCPRCGRDSYSLR